LRINGPVVPLPLHRVNDLTVSLPIISNFFYLLLSSNTTLLLYLQTNNFIYFC
jgi:hypothetical protein